jgi:hypothetical protein
MLKFGRQILKRRSNLGDLGVDKSFGIIKIIAFWCMTLCTSVVYGRFGKTCCLNLRGRKIRLASNQEVEFLPDYTASHLKK